MTQRRKSLSEKDIRTVLAVIESYQEQNRWNWDEMNKHMGSLTIEEMYALQSKLQKWYNPEKYDRDPEDEQWSYDDVVDEYEDVDTDENYGCVCDISGICGGPSCPQYYSCHA